jgi:competence ComEA-like helix-hairpin-helix protein
MLKRIVEWLALTKTERNVILFLVATMIIGAAIRLYQATFPASPQFDYRASDSTFAALSAASEDSLSVVPASMRTGEEVGKLNINTATEQQLMDLPGIGEVTAERILKYRKETGKFTTIEGLRAIKGINKKKLERLSPMITTQ